MFKQKLIPLTSTALLLFSCGAKTTVVELKKPTTIESGVPSIESEEFTATKGQNFTFKVSRSNLPDSNRLLIGATLLFRQPEVEEPYLNFIDIEKGVQVTYNGKKMEPFKGTYNEFLDIVYGDNPEKVENNFLASLTDGGHLISLYHADKKETDTMEFVLDSAIDEKAVIATYVDTVL